MNFKTIINPYPSFNNKFKITTQSVLFHNYDNKIFFKSFPKGLKSEESVKIIELFSPQVVYTEVLFCH
jgi:hypothetical protein